MKFREGEMRGNKKNGIKDNKRPLPPAPAVKSKENEIAKDDDKIAKAIADIYQLALFGAVMNARQEDDDVFSASVRVYKLFQDAELFE